MSKRQREILEPARAAHFLGGRASQLLLRVLIWIGIANLNLWMFFGILSLTDIFPFFDLLNIQLFEWIFLMMVWGLAIWGLFELTRWRKRAVFALAGALALFGVILALSQSPVFGGGSLAFLAVGAMILAVVGGTTWELLE